MRRKNDKEKNYLILIMILSCTIIIMTLINVFKTTQLNISGKPKIGVTAKVVTPIILRF